MHEDGGLLQIACDAVNENLAHELMTDSGCRSIRGPYKDFTFEDAAIMWAFFYRLMFRDNSSQMRSKDIREVLEGLVDLFEIPVAYCDAENSSDDEYLLDIFEV